MSLLDKLRFASALRRQGSLLAVAGPLKFLQIRMFYTLHKEKGLQDHKPGPYLFSKYRSATECRMDPLSAINSFLKLGI